MQSALLKIYYTLLRMMISYCLVKRHILQPISYKKEQPSCSFCSTMADDDDDDDDNDDDVDDAYS